MSDVRISVIMPVYNVEKYVGKAIQSMLDQTFTDFEFLIVDDGSPDRSGDICDRYAAKDGRIRVIHKENGGAPSARNTAIEQARGEYVYFMDADDWAAKTMLADMCRLADEKKADLVVCGYYIDTYYGRDHRTDKLCLDNRSYDSREEFRRESYRYFDKNLLYTPWNKLYRMDLIRKFDLKFPDTMWDDFPFNLSYLDHVERVTFTDRAYYHFVRARSDSETSAYRANMYEKREEEHGWMLALYEKWGIDDPQTEEMVQRRYIERLIGCIANVTSSHCTLSGKERRAEIKRMLANPRVEHALAIAEPRSFYMKLMLVPIRMKSTLLTWLESAVITFVKEKNTRLFTKLKAGR